MMSFVILTSVGIFFRVSHLSLVLRAVSPWPPELPGSTGMAAGRAFGARSGPYVPGRLDLAGTSHPLNCIPFM